MRVQEIIIRYARGQAAPEELEQLSAWRLEDSGNEDEFQEILQLLRLAGRTEPPLSTTPVTAEAIIARAGTAREGRGGRHWSGAGAPAAESGGRVAWWSVLKAAVLVPIGISVGLFLSNSGPESGAVTSAEVTTGIGERTTLVLDGVTVRVGPSSRIVVSHDGQRPQVHLEGRAFFAVKPDPTRRFTVSTPNGQAVALGTRFEVQSQGPALRVMVVEGRVAVDAGAGITEVGAGQTAESVDGRLPVPQQVPDVFAGLAWMGNALVFQGTPLGDAIVEIASRYGAPVMLVDSVYRDAPLTVTFTDQNFDQVIRVICETVQVACDVTGAGARIGVRAPSASGRTM